MGEYFVILPEGEYTSGTYTIPGGYEWDDFKMLIGILGTTPDKMAAVWFPDEMFSSAGWLNYMTSPSDETNAATIRYFSATQFRTPTTGEAGAAVRMFVGYLK